MAQPTRREMLGATALGLSALLGSPAVAASRAMPMPGVQLWTVKDDLARDFAGTLRQLRRIGYRRIEAAGWVGRSPAEFRAGVKSAGLEPFSCHFSMRDLIDEHETELAQARDVGARYVIASSPASLKPIDPAKPWNIGLAEAMTLADWRRNAEAMNRIGARAKAMGMRFGYHNHAAEMLTYEGATALDEILRITDPALVSLELDLGWVAAAGYDPVEMIKRHSARIELLHVKDIATKVRVTNQIAEDLTTTPIGAGTIDWPAVFDAAAKAKVAGWFVEQEPPFTRPPLEGLQQSMAYLRTLGVR
ncbi:sugar phosphate isomerase/epimerase family protein [Sphingomonas radiodurans]|uniref:sugar phosphate isomerase/epimerase family protein n=1 Tax=Sphingomonas radiodurans TaxID=2890321 RepID=UPI001E293ECA|nr:sugar phosphate isomerase/epimerase [Sphingomonas radiodurans]WBH15518.1 sugar phosphate isomerase/epimerase [Sphingomonas radiodurans]